MTRARTYSRKWDDDIEPAGYDHETGERIYHERPHVAEDPRHVHMFGDDRRAGTYPGVYQPIGVPSDPRAQRAHVETVPEWEYSPSSSGSRKKESKHQKWLRYANKLQAKATKIYADLAASRRRDSGGAQTARQQRHIERQQTRPTPEMINSVHQAQARARAEGVPYVDPYAHDDLPGAPPRYGTAPPAYEEAIRRPYRNGRARILPSRSVGPRREPIPATGQRYSPRSSAAGRPYLYEDYPRTSRVNAWNGRRGY
ncbi:hypothetical protein Slin14017_G043570 [Septoria linicola]|nr:hypothetical protein Slin14017_G043570 [Septoria linicola]